MMRRQALLAFTVAQSVVAVLCCAHDEQGHEGPTYSIAKAVQLDTDAPALLLRTMDTETGELTAARFSLLVDGDHWVPSGLGPHGLRFESIHQGKKQKFVALYARGTGTVEIPLPPKSRRGVVKIAKGYDYLPVEVAFEVVGKRASVNVPLARWNKCHLDGWLPADEHVHYDRIAAEHDRDWLTILAGDGLTHAHFLVLRGGNLPGVWAQQFAYGDQGEATDGQRLVRSGEEFRDGRQGHINLLGINEVIQPISTGGIGQPSVPYNFPPLYDVFMQARQLGGIGGPAHGAKLSRSPTAIVDTVLGAVDFFEIANTHLYETSVWYRLMNCGYIVPPVAGTDLPNFPFRDPWQPLLGEVRTYVHVGDRIDFSAWKQAIKRGETFVSSGPVIQLKINGVGPGGTLRLPPGGGQVKVEAELAGPRPLEDFSCIRSGQLLDVNIAKTKLSRVHVWRFEQILSIEESCWLAARGMGQVKQALEQHIGIRQNTMAHTAAVRILVGDKPITSKEDAQFLLQHLAAQQEYYRTEAKYERADHRDRFMQLFAEAIDRLERQTN